MTTPASPLAVPGTWDLVTDGYAELIVPQFALYAADALTLTGLPAASRVLDVASGPGTLTLLAARRAARVQALDFSPSMIATLRARAAREGVLNVEARVGDGQSLPFADASFDRAYSMFGLMFFPDRARGFREMLRVLRPGGRAAVSSWYPTQHAPHVAAVMDAVKKALPALPFGGGRGPLSDPDEFRCEMQAAGFRHVHVETSSHALHATSTTAFLDRMLRSSAPYVLLRRSIGEAAFAEVSQKVHDDLVARFGNGAQVIRWPAYIGVGTR